MGNSENLEPFGNKQQDSQKRIRQYVLDPWEGRGILVLVVKEDSVQKNLCLSLKTIRGEQIRVLISLLHRISRPSTTHAELLPSLNVALLSTELLYSGQQCLNVPPSGFGTEQLSFLTLTCNKSISIRLFVDFRYYMRTRRCNNVGTFVILSQ